MQIALPPLPPYDRNTASTQNGVSWGKMQPSPIDSNYSKLPEPADELIIIAGHQTLCGRSDFSQSEISLIAQIPQG